MKTLLLILSLTAFNLLQAQIESYKITKTDTIELPEIKFTKVAVFDFSEAKILVDYNIFMDHLTTERKGLRKQIRSRDRILKRRPDNIVEGQLNFYKRHFRSVDSIYQVAKHNKLDTFHVDYTRTPILDFIPSAVESKECMVFDLDNTRLKFIIKLSGSKKTGQMTAVGSSFYFIPGATKYFLSKMDWVL